MTTAQENAWLDQEESYLAQVLRAHRWAVQYVAAGEEPDEPPFGYTIGMHGMVHPELVVVGLGSVESHALLQRVATMVVAGRDLVPGEQLSLPERDVTVEQLPNPGEVVLGANRLYRRPEVLSVEAFQLTWAHDGAYPWDPHYPCDPAACQPRPGTWRA
ncbi:DUF4262 domain-containing protein [Klenkia sp. LSe6-5]|uniref:DUF4262 domain-containing protein n=1 Tax=Klenkia sesuvii TaxID=3103137 RepID=A0ABU8DXB4_9ACTN